MSRYLKVGDVAEVLQITRARVYQMIEAGEMEAVTRYVEGGGFRPTRVVSEDEVYRHAKERFDLVPNTDRWDNFAALLDVFAGSSRVLDLNPEAAQNIVDRYDAGESVYSLSRTCGIEGGVSCGTIRKLLESRGREVRDMRAAFDSRSERWMESLPPETVEKVVQRYQSGQGVPSISNDLGWGKPGAKRVQKILEERHVPLRSRSDAAKAAWENRKALA